MLVDKPDADQKFFKLPLPNGKSLIGLNWKVPPSLLRRPGQIKMWNECEHGEQRRIKSQSVDWLAHSPQSPTACAWTKPLTRPVSLCILRTPVTSGCVSLCGKECSPSSVSPCCLARLCRPAAAISASMAGITRKLLPQRAPTTQSAFRGRKNHAALPTSPSSWARIVSRTCTTLVGATARICPR